MLTLCFNTRSRHSDRNKQRSLFLSNKLRNRYCSFQNWHSSETLIEVAIEHHVISLDDYIFVCTSDVCELRLGICVAYRRRSAAFRLVDKEKRVCKLSNVFSQVFVQCTHKYCVNTQIETIM